MRSSSQWGRGRYWPPNGCAAGVFGQQSPSLVYDTGTEVPADAIFLEYRDDLADNLTVEIFPRADGSTHVTAFSAEAPLPLDPADVAPEPDAIERLRCICERLSPAFREERIVARQACFRPITRDFVRSSAACRTSRGLRRNRSQRMGILNAPATGEAMSELIVDGKSRNTDLTPFDPIRLPLFDAALLRRR